MMVMMISINLANEKIGKKSKKLTCCVLDL